MEDATMVYFKRALFYLTDTPKLPIWLLDTKYYLSIHRDIETQERNSHRKCYCWTLTFKLALILLLAANRKRNRCITTVLK